MKSAQTKEHLSLDPTLGNALVLSKEENNFLCFYSSLLYVSNLRIREKMYLYDSVQVL